MAVCGETRGNCGRIKEIKPYLIKTGSPARKQGSGGRKGEKQKGENHEKI
jgi:hypothetical protein